MSVFQVLVVRVDIGMVIYEAMTPDCGRPPHCARSVFLFLVVRVDIGEVTYEAMTQECVRPDFKVLVVRVDIEVMIYEAMTPSVGGQWFRSWLSEWV